MMALWRNKELEDDLEKTQEALDKTQEAFLMPLLVAMI